jgi:hypothetical protein
VRQVDRWLAVAAVVLLLVGVGVGLAHVGGDRVGPVQPPVTSDTPTSAPTTPSQYLAAAQAAIRDADSVTVDAFIHPGSGPVAGRLTVLVDAHGATGSLFVERRGTSRFVADGSHVYVEPAALEWMGLISAREAEKAHGRWISMIGNASLNRFRTLSSLAASLDDPSWPRPHFSNDPAGVTLAVLERTISGTPWRLTMQPSAPHRPLGSEFGPADADNLIGFGTWDAPMTPPVLPGAADIYDPSSPTP